MAQVHLITIPISKNLIFFTPSPSITSPFFCKSLINPSPDSKMLRNVAGRILRIGSQSSPVTSAVQRRLYHERVVDHYNNPRNVGSFDKNDPTVGTGLVGAPACGDVMKLQIKVDEETGKIPMLALRPLDVAQQLLLLPEIAKHLSLPPVKLHCSMLAEDAIKAAVKDYAAKRAKLSDNANDSQMGKAADA